MGPHPGLPGMGPAAAAQLLGFGAGMPGAPGGPHGAAAGLAAAAAAGGAHPLLKSDLHARESADLKAGPGSANTEERLVNKLTLFFFVFG